MIWLNILWFVFAVVFLVLGCYHWKMASKCISHLQVKQLMPQGMKVQITMAGIDFAEHVDKFNRYIDHYNQTSIKQNKVQAIGYWVASIIAVFSFVLIIVS